METKLAKPDIIFETPENAFLSKIRPLYINRQILRENIRFANQNCSNNKSSLSIRGKVKRKKMMGAFRICTKKGSCGLYIDEQRDEQIISRVAKDMSKMKNLRRFYIHFRKCPKLGNASIQCLAQTLQMMKNLKTLRIIFQGGDSLTNFGVRKLIKSIGKCVSLKNLDVRFIVCNNIGDDALLNLEASFKRLVHLRSLRFSLDWCSRITDIGVQKIENTLRHMKKLEKFDFSMVAHNSNTANSANSLRSMINALSSLADSPNLKSVSLNFKRWNLNMDNLAQGLRKFQKLQSLDLNLEWCENLTNEALAGICRTIGGMTTLRNLNLSLEE
jgi:hypothetical protein